MGERQETKSSLKSRLLLYYCRTTTRRVDVVEIYFLPDPKLHFIRPLAKIQSSIPSKIYFLLGSQVFDMIDLKFSRGRMNSNFCEGRVDDVKFGVRQKV